MMCVSTRRTQLNCDDLGARIIFVGGGLDDNYRDIYLKIIPCLRTALSTTRVFDRLILLMRGAWIRKWI